MRIELADSEIDRAHDEMTAARRRLGDYRSPCMDDPLLFDPQDGEVRETWAQFGRRAAVAAELCVTACRILRQCQLLHRADPDIQGIIAGRMVTEENKGGSGATTKA